MQEKTPSGGLKRVRQEILAHLDRARRAFANEGDSSDAVAALFEVRGILLTLPLPAAATLAEEMQRTAEALSGANATTAARIREALGLALARAPAYLTRIEAGGNEDPLALLPAINALRDARELSPMNAAELLLPASVLAAAEPLSSEGLERIARIARKVRPHFHRYLVRWFGDSDPEAGLIGLSRLFNQTRRYFKDGPAHELFLAAEGVVEGLLTGAIIPDPPCKALVGRIDKVLKPLTAQPAPQWPEEVASVLLSDLLAQLSQMPPGSPVVQELERAYGRRLNAGNAQDAGDGDTALLLETLRQELAPIATLLAPGGVLVSADRTAVATRLKRLGESFALIGQEALALRLGRCADALTTAADPDRISEIVGTLAQVDAELQAIGELARPKPPLSLPASPRVRDLTAATLREARTELAAIRASLSQAPLTDADPTRMSGVVAALAMVAEALGGVGELEPARLLSQLGEQMQVRYLTPGQMPGEAGVELIRRALAAVDIHLEDRLQRDGVDPRMLGEAALAIERLSTLLTADQALVMDTDSESQPASEVSHSVNIEFLGLFLDEAEEVIEGIRRQHARWLADPTDEGALAELYRSFQALKASGGLVGAQQLAELARLTGNLLDRLLEHDLTAAPPVPGFLEAVVRALPEAVQAEAERRPPEIADLLTKGKALLAISDPVRPSATQPITVPLPPVLTPPSSMLMPASEELTVEPMTDIAATDDFEFAQRTTAAGDWQAPPVEGLLVETTELDTSLREAFAVNGRSIPELGATAPDTVEEVAFLDDADLGQVFADEARDLIAGLDDWLRAAREEVFSEPRLAAARRRLHTLKGTAHMAGLGPIGDLSHALESLLSPPEGERPGQSSTSSPPPFELVQQTVDQLAAQVEAAAEERPIPVAAALISALEATAGDAVPAAAGGTEVADPPATAEVPTALPLRLSPQWLDTLINLAGEVGAYRARLTQQNTRLGFRRAQLGESLNRLNRRLQRLAADVGGEPPQPERAEAALRQARDLVSEATRLLDSVGDLQRDNMDLLQAQGRLATSMQDRLLESRMVPFSRIEPRLQRLVRQAAASLGKEVMLAVDGLQVELDRTVLERFLVPLEHLLRNAVAHGIEPPALRRQHGKPACGAVQIRLGREGNDIVFEITDDGAGMDPQRIRTHAEARGLIAPGARLDDEALLTLTMQPGFSTADTVTQLSGRGVGLDVVKAEINGLNGEVTLRSTAGTGTTFHIRLPLTLSLVDALLVHAGGNLFALPHASLLAVARIERDRLSQPEPATAVAVSYQGEDYRVVSLARTLQQLRAGGGRVRLPPLPRRRWLPALLVRAAGQRIAFQVDALAGSQRLMVKPIGPPLSNLRWLTGGTLLADGRVALLLDLPALIRARDVTVPATGKTGARHRVLAVDESERVRRCARHLLGRPDLLLLTARDQAEVDALLRREPPDLLLLDSQPGQVNGLGLVRRLRTIPELRQLPVIMLIADEDEGIRRQALAAGVDRLLHAPMDEQAFNAELDAVLPCGDG